MSREWMLKTLVGFGLSQVEAEVYLFLAQFGPLKGREIAVPLELYRQQLYRVLRSLRCRGCVKATFEHPARFSAVPIEKVLELFMKVKLEQAAGLQASRDELLSTWRSMNDKDSSNS